MPDQYSMHAIDVTKKLKEYNQELDKILNFSTAVSRDVVKFALRVIRDEDNLEVAKVIAEKILERKVPLAVILKIIIKLLYVLKNTKRYGHSGYYIVKKFVDKALREYDNTTAKLARKKYPIILESLLQDDIDSPTKKRNIQNRHEVYEDVKDNITKRYLNFL